MLNAISMLREDESLEIGYLQLHIAYILFRTANSKTPSEHISIHFSCGHVYNKSAALALDQSLRDFTEFHFMFIHQEMVFELEARVNNNKQPCVDVASSK